MTVGCGIAGICFRIVSGFVIRTREIGLFEHFFQFVLAVGIYVVSSYLGFSGRAFDKFARIIEFDTGRGLYAASSESSVETPS